MVMYDAQTGFQLGDPQVTPLSEQSQLPTMAEFQKEFSAMILSASGWRKVFALSGNEEDATTEIGAANGVLSALIAQVFADYIIQRCGPGCKIALGLDARPTGTQIGDIIARVLAGRGIQVEYLFITAAPEIMAYSRQLDGFVYVSASHNPVGHNGIKFGLNDGGVLPGEETAKLTAAFTQLCSNSESISLASQLVAACSEEAIQKIFAETASCKARAVASYRDFTRLVVSGTEDQQQQKAFFDLISQTTKKKPLSVSCDMNGSARTLSIDKDFLPECGIGFDAINNKPRNIVHAIIPEPENLVHCARFMEEQKPTNPAITLGYMPDCDGDRGNIVYWDDASGKSQVLKAQEVFALSVLAELAYLDYRNESTAENAKPGVSVNDPTSMRIEEIAAAFDATVFRAEVGEANVVNLAREARQKGYTVPILGEGSNGGNITHPAAVRDPINTIFALVKLLAIQDTTLADGSIKQGLFHRWCSKSGQEAAYKADFTLADIIATLPVYTTTGVSESRALLKIKTTDHGMLKARFQKEFEASWQQKKEALAKEYGIASYEAICNNGTKETRNLSDYSLSGKGGLKILFKDAAGKNTGFIWMRGSGTEPVFRILCDVRGSNKQMEEALLAWETELLEKADS
ncbi:MAG: phosphoglucomutase [Treponema sp.]|nr:phosphoglucomutase [Treponema sp.]